MANSFDYKENHYAVGDTIDIIYKVVEGDKERQQSYKGILLAVKGMDEATRMITVRKMTRSGIGVERIIPLSTPNLVSIKLIKKSNYNKAKLYFVRGLSEQKVKGKLYQSK